MTESQGGSTVPNVCVNLSYGKSNRFLEAKGKKRDKKTATALLTEGCVFFSDLRSEKTGKTYAAAILLEDDGTKTNYKLDFTKGGIKHE